MDQVGDHVFSQPLYISKGTQHPDRFSEQKLVKNETRVLERKVKERKGKKKKKKKKKKKSL